MMQIILIILLLYRSSQYRLYSFYCCSNLKTGFCIIKSFNATVTCPSGLIRYQEEMAPHGVRFKCYISKMKFWPQELTRQLHGTNNSDGDSEHRSFLHTRHIICPNTVTGLQRNSCYWVNITVYMKCLCALSACL